MTVRASTSPALRESGTDASRRERDARLVRLLAWCSLAWMAVEGVVGLWQGYAGGSVALVGWAWGSVVEGLASAAVVWRFGAGRIGSGRAERRAQQLAAVSYWLLVPYLVGLSVVAWRGGRGPDATAAAVVVVAVAVVAMPVLGSAKRRLAVRLDSVATAAEAGQNWLCAAQAAAVLATLALSSAWRGGWWIDPVVGLAVAAVAVREGVETWRGGGCCAVAAAGGGAAGVGAAGVEQVVCRDGCLCCA